MITRFLRFATFLCGLALLVEPAAAEVNIETVDTCLTTRLTEGEAPGTCINDAQTACMTVDNEAPAVATLCFVEAEKDWQAGISNLMGQIADAAPEEIALIAGIELKYDLLSALLQCSRMEELSLGLGRESEADILRQNARCKANAAGFSYARLYLRSQDLR